MSVTIIAGATETKNATLLSQNIFEEGTVTVSSETADGAGLNAVEDTTFDFWTPAAVPANITVDYGTSVECDCLGIASHDAGTNGTDLRLEHSSDGVIWTQIGSDVSPLTDDTIMIVFQSTSARYWRVVQATSVCSIGVIKLGKRLVMPSGVLSGFVGVNHANRVDLLTNTSIKGQYLGTRIKRIGAETNINFGMIETSFADNDFAVFEEHFNSGRTFFYAGSPSEWPEDYGYCWRTGGEIRPSYEEGGILAQVDMDVSIYVEQ